MYALRERDGPAATDVFVTAAFHASRHVSGQGMDALERAGDGRAWDEAFSALGVMLSRKVSAGTLRGGQALAAMEYLAGHAEPGSDRAIRLVTLVRDRWRVLGIQVSVERRWPLTSGNAPLGTLVRRLLEGHSAYRASARGDGRMSSGHDTLANARHDNGEALAYW